MKELLTSQRYGDVGRADDIDDIVGDDIKSNEVEKKEEWRKDRKEERGMMSDGR